MSIDKQYFSTGVSAFFEMATSDAERILPPHLQPIEVRPQRSILNVTAFHFRESEVGPYAELTFSVVVPPVTGSWIRHPKAGFYPFVAATTSEESRRHRSSGRYRIPHYQKDIEAHFIERAGELRVRARAEDLPIVDFTVTQHLWRSTTHLLHGFMMDGTQRFKADIQISGRYTVHELERGRMVLYQHPMTQALTLEEVSPYPFREHWLKEGTEVFHPLEVL
jgi:hypothetical protein